MSDRTINYLPNMLLLVGVLVLLLGLIQYGTAVYSANSQPSHRPARMPTLKERELAIKEAERNGQSKYSFTTRFTPGIGYAAGVDTNESYLPKIDLPELGQVAQ